MVVDTCSLSLSAFLAILICFLSYIHNFLRISFVLPLLMVTTSMCGEYSLEKKDLFFNCMAITTAWSYDNFLCVCLLRVHSLMLLCFIVLCFLLFFFSSTLLLGMEILDSTSYHL